jgi:large subunit ribosomal protein L4
VLIVTQDVDANLGLAARNIPSVQACAARQVNPVDLIGSDKVLVTVAALKQIEEMLS